ncbi:MAG TPA: hypothetical protein VGH51_18150 [Candidatus Angelobacter sp.]|jgi:hypothetical protein
MKQQSHSAQPPHIAAWLVSLFTPAEEAGPISGDLLEEFSELAAKSGVAFARNWYRRQTVKTIAHLAGNGFRMAPWSTAATIVGGFLLLRFSSGWPELAIAAVVNRSSFYEHHFDAYMFWMTSGIDLGHVIVAALVGGMVALAARDREMITTMTLALLSALLMAIAAFVIVPRFGVAVFLPRLLWSLADSFAIVTGGVIVRMRRSAGTTLGASDPGSRTE